MTRRVLIVAPFAPATDARHGGGRALHGLSCALSAHLDLSIVHVDDGNQPDPFLVQNCRAVHAVTPGRPSPGRRRLIDAAQLMRGRPLWTSRCDMPKLSQCVVAVMRRHHPEIVHIENPVVGDMLRWVGVGTSRVVSVHEPASLRRENIQWRSHGGEILRRVDAAVAVRHERSVLRLTDAAVVFTERDGEAVRAQGARRVDTIPLGFHVGDALHDASGTGDPVLLFVGNFEHPPNVEAAVRLVRGVLPQVHRTHPDAVAQIVGASPTPAVLALRGRHVHVAGDVDDVAPYLSRASVVVVPVGTGGGTRVKVLEALAAGRPIVATSRATEGIDVHHGVHVVVADRDGDIAAAVSRLLDDEQERRALGTRAHQWARRELSWRSMAERYEELYDELRRPRSMVSSSLPRSGRRSTRRGPRT